VNINITILSDTSPFTKLHNPKTHKIIFLLLFGTHLPIITGVRKSSIGILKGDMLKGAIATSASFLVMTPIIPFHFPFTSMPQCTRGSKNCVLENEWKYDRNISTRLTQENCKYGCIEFGHTEDEIIWKLTST
jgi:hypothetical protein